MIKIEVQADSVRSINAKSGKSYRLQTGYCYTLAPDGKPHPHPVRAEWFLGDNDQPASPGVYLLAPASIYVDRQGRLAVAPRLVPVASAK